MRSGALNRRITMQHRSTAQDAYGAQVDTWTDIGNLWATIEPLTGRELMTAQAVQSEVSHRITIRYQAQFSVPAEVAKMRISYNGRLFNIQSAVDFEESHKMIEIMATEGMNQG